MMTEISFVDILCIIFIFTICVERIIETIKGTSKNDEIIKETKQTKSQWEFEDMRLFKEYDVFHNVNSAIDQFIMNYIEIYQRMTPPDEVNYITSEATKDMRKYVLASIKKYMSHDFIQMIKLCYRINNEKDLDDLIALRTDIILLEILKINKTNPN